MLTRAAPRNACLCGLSGLVILANCGGCGNDVTCGDDTAGPPVVRSYEPSDFGGEGLQILEFTPCAQQAPLSFWVFAPQRRGTYPVVVFQHGLTATPLSYSEILLPVARQGFVVIAPQLFAWEGSLLWHPPASSEVQHILDLVAWLPEELTGLEGVSLDTSRIGLVGHSRGGKIAWMTARALPERLAAVAVIDPVDSTSMPLGNQESAVLDQPEVPMPSLVIGGGLEGPCFFGHDELFFEASSSPAWRIVALEMGHLDTFDEAYGLPAVVCARSPRTAEIRRWLAAMLAGFFDGWLRDRPAALQRLTNTRSAPTPLEITTR